MKYRLLFLFFICLERVNCPHLTLCPSTYWSRTDRTVPALAQRETCITGSQPDFSYRKDALARFPVIAKHTSNIHLRT